MLERLPLLMVMLFVFSLLACGPTPEQSNNAGHQPYLAGDYQDALDTYREAQTRLPESGEPYYNAGNALYRLGEYEESIKEYDAGLKLAQDELRTQGFFNRGNAEFQQGQYPQAIEAYKEVLRMDPDHGDAKHNLELALLQVPPPADSEERQEEQDEQQEDQQQDEEQEDQQDAEEEKEEQQEQEEPLTQDQARQLLESVGESAQTLQERRGQTLVSSKPPSEFDW